MPKGSPNPQTIASQKYQQKAGYMTKGFKIKREVAERFDKGLRGGRSQPGWTDYRADAGICKRAGRKT